MAQLTYRDAVAAGIAQEMRRDPNVVLLGEDVAAAGGVFKTTVGLLDEFGPKRVSDTPISEQAIVGRRNGRRDDGTAPDRRHHVLRFLRRQLGHRREPDREDALHDDGQVTLPLVIRSANGAGSRFGAQHSQSVENWAMMIPGLKIVAPGIPADVKGLLAAAIRSDDPVMFFEQKSLYATKGEVPDGEHFIELGKANVLRDGKDVTIVALALMVPRALKAADILQEQHGIDATVDRSALARAARHADDPASKWRRPGGSSRSRRTRGSAAGAPRSPRSWPRSCSGISTARSCASRRRTCRSRPRTTSRTRNCLHPSESSLACAGR